MLAGMMPLICWRTSFLEALETAHFLGTETMAAVLKLVEILL